MIRSRVTQEMNTDILQYMTKVAAKFQIPQLAKPSKAELKTDLTDLTLILLKDLQLLNANNDLITSSLKALSQRSEWQTVVI